MAGDRIVDRVSAFAAEMVQARGTTTYDAYLLACAFAAVAEQTFRLCEQHTLGATFLYQAADRCVARQAGDAEVAAWDARL